MNTASADIQGLLSHLQSASLISTKELRSNVQSWKRAVHRLTDGHQPESDEEEEELKSLLFFVDKTLDRRIDEIDKAPRGMQSHYLRSIFPFFSTKGMLSTLTRLFDLDYEHKQFKFRLKQDFERELNILLDLYKIKKSIECINSIKRRLIEEEPLHTRLEGDPLGYLETLKEILKVFFIQFVRPEYQKELYHHLNEEQISAEKLMSLKKENLSYIKPEVLGSRAYQAKMLLLLYSTKMRTLTKGKTVDLDINYMDFEILKQDFLIDWMKRKLEKSKTKTNILKNQMIAGHSIGELIEAHPDLEHEILLAMPQEQFNDVAAEINENVDQDKRSGIAIFSEKFGPIRRIKEQLSKAKAISEGVVKIKEALPPKAKGRIPFKELDVSALSHDQVDYCFYDPVAESYPLKFKVMKSAFGPKYEEFHKKVMTLLQSVADESLVNRTKPYNELGLPIYLEGEEVDFFLGVGMQAKLAKYEKGQKMQSITCYFNLSTSEPIPDYGPSNGQRIIKGNSFYQYPTNAPNVIDDVNALLDALIQSKEKSRFREFKLAFKQ